MPGVSTISAPQSRHDLTPFQAHRIGHGQDQVQALHGGDQGQADACIAASRFDDDRILIDFPLTDSFFNHGRCDAVLDAAQGIHVLQFSQNPGLEAVPGLPMGQFQKRRVANQLGQILCHMLHILSSFLAIEKRHLLMQMALQIDVCP